MTMKNKAPSNKTMFNKIVKSYQVGQTTCPANSKAILWAANRIKTLEREVAQLKNDAAFSKAIFNHTVR